MPCCMAVRLVPQMNYSGYRTMLHVLSHSQTGYEITASITFVTLVASTTTTGLQDRTNHVQVMTTSTPTYLSKMLTSLLDRFTAHLIAHCLPFPK